MHKLFDSFAGWYDFHTPPDHYFRDHELVLSLAAHFGQGARLLDVGCGTGVLVEKAQAAGFDAAGFDASEYMIDVARKRLRESSVWVQRMQDLATRNCYDIVVSLSWCIHYCRSVGELRATIARMNESLGPGGRLLLQVAHGPNLPAEWAEDREIGPTGLADDVRLRFRFQSDPTRADTLFADYEFNCASTGESFNETHQLNVVNANIIAELTRDAGFDYVEIWNSWRRDAFADSGNVFVTGVRRAY
jgi:SAM-dependent methyltransferase